MFGQAKNIFENKDTRLLARLISLVENEAEGYIAFLQTLPFKNTAKIIGITGPPGAGKSTLTDGLIAQMVAANKKVAVLCIDPSSPFNLGALLGDRIRMSQWYNNPNVYIRSLATRGSLGGLHPKIIEITDVLSNAWFDYIIVETVGVGQSEIEIAGLADVTAVVLVPEAGDEIQTMKAGLMEIASLFIVNKSDRPGADTFIKNLKQMLAPSFNSKIEIPIIKTVASKNEGLGAAWETIEKLATENLVNERKAWLLTNKAWHLMAQNFMKIIDKNELQNQIIAALILGKANIYSIISNFEKRKIKSN
jgi:LAO/AO transport system kinase